MLRVVMRGGCPFLGKLQRVPGRRAAEQGLSVPIRGRDGVKEEEKCFRRQSILNRGVQIGSRVSREQ